jgi:photosystem II stability/assembly factor-like uncharacterized protein
MTIALSHGGPTIYDSQSRSEDVLVGTANGVVRLARRSDGWEATETTLEGKHIGALLIEPTTGKIFAGSYIDGGVDVSDDGGHTWSPSGSGMTETNVYSLESKVIDGKVRLFCGTEPAKLFVSDDLGASWSERPGLRDVPTRRTSRTPSTSASTHATRRPSTLASRWAACCAASTAVTPSGTFPACSRTCTGC